LQGTLTATKTLEKLVPVLEVLINS
jgi:hypothetical protein